MAFSLIGKRVAAVTCIVFEPIEIVGKEEEVEDRIGFRAIEALIPYKVLGFLRTTNCMYFSYTKQYTEEAYIAVIYNCLGANLGSKFGTYLMRDLWLSY